MGECAECGKPTRNKYCGHWKCRWPNRTYQEHQEIEREKRKRKREKRLALQAERQTTLRKEREKRRAFLLQEIRRAQGEPLEALAKRLKASFSTIVRIRRDELKEPPHKQRGIYLEHKGERRTASEWAKLLGINLKTLNTRRRTGWPVERILETPPQVVRLTPHRKATCNAKT